MLKVKKIVTSLIVTVLSFGFLSTTISAAEATENKSTAIVQQDVKKIEQEVRFIFEEASSYKNGVVSVKDELLKMKYGKVMAAYIAEGIRQVYTNDNLLDAIRANSQDKDFWSCMGGELIGLIPGWILLNCFPVVILKLILKGMLGISLLNSLQNKSLNLD